MRCVGWYPTFERAEEAVINNEQDIYEMGYYPYCVIEKVGFGIYYIIDREEKWYVWDRKINRYGRIEKPSLLSNSCCFSIG